MLNVTVADSFEPSGLDVSVFTAGSGLANAFRWSTKIPGGYITHIHACHLTFQSLLDIMTEVWK